MITNDIAKIACLLNQGEVAVVPTETVYGLAASINFTEAIKKVYALKSRPLNHPLIVHIGDIQQVEQLAKNITITAYQLMKNFWPGPLTLVLEKNESLSDLITGGQDSIAIRFPSHPQLKKLFPYLKSPFVAPSANKFSKLSPTTAHHVEEAFLNEKLSILEGGRCSVGLESTIIDARYKSHLSILRNGIISQQTIYNIVNVPFKINKTPPNISGNLKKHYQPIKPLHIFKNVHQLRNIANVYQNNIKLIFYSNEYKPFSNPYGDIWQINSPKHAAFELYYQLHLADKSDVSATAIEWVNDKDWQSINDKLVKAESPLP